MGYVVYFMNVPVCWRSKGQKSVTLSTTEAEYVACSERGIIHIAALETSTSRSSIANSCTCR